MGLVLIQGAEGLLADRAVAQIIAEHAAAQVTNISIVDIEIGFITDALAPSLFGDQRIVVIKEIQDLDGDCSDEIGDYLENQDDNYELICGKLFLSHQSWHLYQRQEFHTDQPSSTCSPSRNFQHN